MSSAVCENNSNNVVHLFPTTISTAVKMLKYQNIAPSTDCENKSRKFSVRDTHIGCNVDQTQSVQRRNARERNRVKQVNNSFAKLRQHIPQSIIADLTKGGGRGPQKKVSKVDTLRIAVEYIRRLQSLVDELNNSSCSSSSTRDLPRLPNSVTKQLQPTTKSHMHQQLFKCTSNTPPEYILHQQQNFPNQSESSTILKPICLNTLTSLQTQFVSGCHSPTSSFNSSMSFDSGTYDQTTPLSPDQVPATVDAHLQLKFEPYDEFNINEEDCTPDDEELLDYISLWQQQ